MIRTDPRRAVQECLNAIGEHPRQLWDAPGIWLAAGRRPVRGVVGGLRRELEYHHVDLAAGYQPDDWPADFAATELCRVTALLDRRADAPHDPDQIRHLAHSHDPEIDVTGPPAAILAWLSGRGVGSELHPPGAALPAIPPQA